MFRLQKIGVTGDPSGSELLAVARFAEGPERPFLFSLQAFGPKSCHAWKARGVFEMSKPRGISAGLAHFRAAGPSHLSVRSYVKSDQPRARESGQGLKVF